MGFHELNPLDPLLLVCSARSLEALSVLCLGSGSHTPLLPAELLISTAGDQPSSEIPLSHLL